MKLTTLCYIEKDDKYLMLHRVKKINDQSHNKWLGIGGKFQDGESPEMCIIREALEETGLILTEPSYRGIVTFVSDEYETEYMHLFTADKYEGLLQECDEGELVWVKKQDIFDLELWKGDKLFLKLLMEGAGFFSMRLVYKGEELVSSEVREYRHEL